MKIDIYCNDYFMRYNAAQLDKDSLKQLRSGYIRGIVNEEDMFILRGEPAFHYDFKYILDSFKKQNYILTTHGNNADAIISYDRKIPYISFNWDGFINDSIKGHKPLTSEITRTLQYLNSTDTVVRIAYTISPFNIKWLATDAVVLRKMMDAYPKMKQPYFMLYQEGTYYSQDEFTWTSISYEDVNNLNKLGLLTEKNLSYLLSWINRKDYQCTAPINDVVIMSDATVRTCQSYRMSEVLGSLDVNNLPDIISQTKEKRSSLINCEYKERCWFACNLKDSLYGSGK